MQPVKLGEDEISYRIVTAAIEVHRTLGGPGLLESVYEEALVWELRETGLDVERQKRLPVLYKGQTLATPLCIDVLVNNLVIVECKSTEEYHVVFEAQTLTYLRLTGLRLGMVINFGERYVKNGIKRVVNNL
ncbi:MAG: GxxExxY protein [Chloroflexi bacterium]|nr:GxxExxY protein [Chloroflexota bacterium]